MHRRLRAAERRKNIATAAGRGIASQLDEPQSGGRFFRPSPSFAVPRLMFALLFLSINAFAQSPDTLFQSRCAQCHSANNAVNAPLPETLRQMSWQAVLTALEGGKMK